MSDEKYKGYYRVTEVLSPYSNFSGIDPDVLANAADRGTRVHNFCELYASKMLFLKVDEDCEPYVNSFVEWFEDFVDKVIFLERRLFCDELNITGQVDMLAVLKGNTKPSIIDMKTPQSASKTWRLQLAAYSHLLSANNIDCDGSFCLQLDKRGLEAKLWDFSSRADQDLDTFKSALKAYKFFNPIS